jgi:DNA invertase Pin-like site-specific DNA recombinase
MPRRKPDPKRAVGYIRVSTRRQKEKGLSLDHQRDAIEAYCAAEGLELVDVLVDGGVSAYSQPLHRRQAGARLVELVESGQVGSVVALRLDRMFRDMIEGVNGVLEWSARGVAARLLNFGGVPLDTSKAMGKIFLSMMAGLAEMESEIRSERIRDAWEVRLNQGRRMGGKAPFGFRFDPSDKGLPVPDPAEQAALTLIREMDAAGAGASAIRRALVDGGHQPRGKAWHLKTIDRLRARVAEAA